MVIPSRERLVRYPTVSKMIADSGVEIVIGTNGEYDFNPDHSPDYEYKRALHTEAQLDPSRQKDLHAMALHEAPEPIIAKLYYEDGLTIQEISHRLDQTYFSVHNMLMEYDAWMGIERKSHGKGAIKQDTLPKRYWLRPVDLEARSRSELRQKYAVGDQPPPDSLRLKDWHIWSQLMRLRQENPSSFAALSPEVQLILAHSYHLSQEVGTDLSQKDFAHWLGMSHNKYLSIRARTLYELLYEPILE